MYICLYLLYFAFVVDVAAAVFYSLDICLSSHITRRNHDDGDSDDIDEDGEKRALTSERTKEQNENEEK